MDGIMKIPHISNVAHLVHEAALHRISTNTYDEQRPHTIWSMVKLTMMNRFNED